ncbi:MAG: metallophosphoesterase [Lewinella sp.]|nr:metallophosphoesterase [Lewinella sp.]
MGFRQMIFLGLLLTYVVGVIYLIVKRPYEAFAPGQTRTVAKWLFVLSVAYIPLAIGGLFFFGRPHSAFGNFFLGMVGTVFFTHLALIAYFLVVDIAGLFQGAGRWALQLESAPRAPERRRAVRQLGLLFAAIPFGAYLHGITRGKYNFQVRKLTLTFPDLPAAFNGFRLVQISDMHSGSFDDPEKVKRGLELVQEQSADLIVFTGDLVNGHAEEVTPYADYLRNMLQAPFGKFAVMGNHDYYGPRDAKGDNPVKAAYGEVGFDLLNDRSVTLEKDGQHISLVGVENWGRPPFPQIGDLDRALADVDPDDFKILLSHDPTHWDEKTLPHPQKVHLTLSGHTHGMQMGVNLPGLKWSPARFVYPRWLGLYEEAGQYLYVNRGFGWLGFPGRVGMYPEITVFELRREQAG